MSLVILLQIAEKILTTGNKDVPTTLRRIIVRILGPVNSQLLDLLKTVHERIAVDIQLA